MSAGDAQAEYWVLTTGPGNALLNQVSAVTTPGPADLTRWRTRESAERVNAAVRIAATRRRAAPKFANAAAMWFDATGLEQSTAEAVARHKAMRFAPAGVAFDLCSGIGSDSIAIAAAGPGVISVDLDPASNRRTLWNAAAYGVAEKILAVRNRAQATPMPPSAWAHIDPDRRAGRSVRAKSLEGYEPGVAFLQSVARSQPGGAFKLGPASDFATAFDDPSFEIELISLGGECKEATVWFGAAANCRRRATCLPAGTTWTDRDGPAGSSPACLDVGAWVYDPDPSLARAGLLDAFAVAHGLARLSAGIDYLTSADRVVSPFLPAYEVVETFPLDMKAVRRGLTAHKVGPLDVKIRGVELTPEAVRTRLKLDGDRPATLLLHGGATRGAILARRIGSLGQAMV